MTSTTQEAASPQVATTQVYQIFIRATAQAIWDAVVKPEFTARYFYGARVETTAEVGAPFRYHSPDGSSLWGDERVLESDRPHRLVVTWRSLFDEETAGEPRHVGDRAAGRGAVPAHRRPRPPRGLAEDGAVGLRPGLDDGAQRTQDPARDGREPDLSATPRRRLRRAGTVSPPSASRSGRAATPGSGRRTLESDEGWSEGQR